MERMYFLLTVQLKYRKKGRLLGATVMYHQMWWANTSINSHSNIYIWLADFSRSAIVASEDEFWVTLCISISLFFPHSLLLVMRVYTVSICDYMKWEFYCRGPREGCSQSQMAMKTIWFPVSQMTIPQHYPGGRGYMHDGGVMQRQQSIVLCNRSD